MTRYVQGLGLVTPASQDQPWGYFLGYGLFSGVPLGTTAHIGTAVSIFGVGQCRPMLRNAILIGFLSYLWAVLFQLIDLGCPWQLPYPVLLTFGIGGSRQS